MLPKTRNQYLVSAWITKMWYSKEEPCSHRSNTAKDKLILTSLAEISSKTCKSDLMSACCVGVVRTKSFFEYHNFIFEAKIKLY